MSSKLIRLLLVVALVTFGLGVGGAMARDGSCGESVDLRLVNGNIITMDPSNPVASSVLIRDGRIAAVGDSNETNQGLGPCGQIINLRGHTVTPGLIDSHMHFLRAGLRPGHDVRTIETAFSIGEVQAELSKRAAEAPEGEFLTAINGYIPEQFAWVRIR